MCVFGKQSFGDFDMHMLFYTCSRTPSFIPDVFLEDLLYIRHFAKHWGPGDEGHSFFPLRCSQSPGRKLMNNYNIVGSSRNTSGLCRAVRALEGEGVTAACKWGSVLGICSELARIREKAPHSDWATSLSLFTFMHWRRQWHPTPVFLPGESQGRGSLVGCRLWGHTELDTTEVT